MANQGYGENSVVDSLLSRIFKPKHKTRFRAYGDSTSQNWFLIHITLFFFFFLYIYIYIYNEWAQCALSLAYIPQEKEKKGSKKNKTSLQNI